MRLRVVLISALSVLFSQGASAAKPLALIYFGEGSCLATRTTTGCSESARAIAEKAGFDVQYVGPDGAHAAFDKAAVWIQPGGYARVQVKVMTAGLKTAIRDFVQAGGGYVGFCAGGFLASEKFGWETEKGPFEAAGLGLIPGKSYYYDLFDPELSETLLAKIVDVSWLGQKRSLYWELGPYFEPSSVRAGLEVVSVYPMLGSTAADPNHILSLRGTFGAGRIFVTAVHPEAPQDWRAYYNLKDSDGVDFELARSMITWSAAK